MADLLTSVFGSLLQQISSTSGCKLERAELEPPLGGVITYRAPRRGFTIVNMFPARGTEGAQAQEPIVIRTADRQVTIKSNVDLESLIAQILSATADAPAPEVSPLTPAGRSTRG